jgi:hypothetical protein
MRGIFNQENQARPKQNPNYRLQNQGKQGGKKISTEGKVWSDKCAVSQISHFFSPRLIKRICRRKGAPEIGFPVIELLA